MEKQSLVMTIHGDEGKLSFLGALSHLIGRRRGFESNYITNFEKKVNFYAEEFLGTTFLQAKGFYESKIFRVNYNHKSQQQNYYYCLVKTDKYNFPVLFPTKSSKVDTISINKRILYKQSCLSDVSVLIWNIDNLNFDPTETLILARVFQQQLIVCVNKMDKFKYSEEKYLKLEKIIQSKLLKYGYKNAPIIPIALYGEKVENFQTIEDSMSWYRGPTVIEALDNLKYHKKSKDDVFRMRILRVDRIGGIGYCFIGKVLSGSPKKSEYYHFPTEDTQILKQIESFDNQIDKAKEKDYISLNLKFAKLKSYRQHFISDKKESFDKVVKFEAQLFVKHKNGMKIGYESQFHNPISTFHCKLTKCFTKFDLKYDSIESNPHFLENGKMYYVEFKLMFEKDAYLDLSFSYDTFFLTDQSEIVGYGKIQRIFTDKYLEHLMRINYKLSHKISDINFQYL